MPPPRPEKPLLGADEADCDPRAREARERSEELGVRLGVGDDEVGGAKRGSIESEQGACRNRPGSKPPPIVHERLVERDERVEDDRSAACGAPGRGQVGLAGIADDEGIDVPGHAAGEAHLCERDPSSGSGARSPPFTAPFPHGHVALYDLDPGAAKRRDHLGVPRIVPLVRAEIENLQERISSTSSSARSRSGARSSWWLVIISLIRPSEKNCSPTTTRSTPSVRSGRPPIAWPSSLRTVR